MPEKLSGTPSRKVIDMADSMKWAAIIAVSLGVSLSADASVSFIVGQKGLDSLKLNGFESIGDPSYQGEFCLYGCIVQRVDAHGNLYSDNRVGQSVSSGNSIVYTAPAAKVVATYRQVDANRIAIDIAVTNTGTDRLVAINGNTMIFDTPVVPGAVTARGSEALDSFPHTIDPPRGWPALQVTYGKAGSMLLSIENDPRLKAGFDTIGIYNSDQRYSIRWSMTEPLDPGQSKTMTLGIASGRPGQSFASLAATVTQRYAGAFAQTSANWTDRRPIGRWIMTTTVPHCANGKNPRGWNNNDCTIDVTSPAGLVAFRAFMLNWTDQTIANLKYMNAQGVVIWDVEGEEFPQATSYVCDPRQLDTVAPEMAFKPAGEARGVVDEIFHRLAQAGLKTGVCVRPQDFIKNQDGSAGQHDVADPGSLIAAKAAYANARWGSTIFYTDSNVHPDYGAPIPEDFLFGAALAQLPGALFIPEWMDVRGYGIGAPYQDTNRPGAVDSLPDARLQYPGGFGIVIPQDAANGTPVGNRLADYLPAARRGDILMANAWYPDASLPLIHEATLLVGTRPSVGVVAPAAKVPAGPVTLGVTIAGAGRQVRRVDYYSGGTRIGSATSAPWKIVWQNPASLVHSLVASVTDSAGVQTFSPPLTLTVGTLSARSRAR